MPANDDSPEADLEQVAEARRLVAELIPMLKRTGENEGETVRITLDLPKEYAILAAWLALKADMKGAVLDRPVMLRFDDGRRTHHWQRAKTLLSFLLGEALNQEWQKLRHMAHPQRDFADAGAPAHLRERPPPDEILDNEIPF